VDSVRKLLLTELKKTITHRKEDGKNHLKRGKKCNFKVFVRCVDVGRGGGGPGGGGGGGGPPFGVRGGVVVGGRKKRKKKKISLEK